jgi:hypothetical protein
MNYSFLSNVFGMENTKKYRKSLLVNLAWLVLQQWIFVRSTLKSRPIIMLIIILLYSHNHHHPCPSHLHHHHHHHHHRSVSSFLSFSSTNVIVYIWQTTHYKSTMIPSGFTHSCRLAPVIYEIIKMRICTTNSTIGDLYTQNQYHYISETRQKLCRPRLHKT